MDNSSFLFHDSYFPYSYFHFHFFDRRDLKYDDFEYTRVDATVAERLSPSPLIYDIYGHCGIGIMSEWFPYGDMEEVSIDYDNYPPKSKIREDMKKEELVVYNDIAGNEKLKAALNMAQAIATLHGHSGGVIVHQVRFLTLFLWVNSRKSMIFVQSFFCSSLFFSGCSNVTVSFE